MTSIISGTIMAFPENGRAGFIVAENHPIGHYLCNRTMQRLFLIRRDCNDRQCVNALVLVPKVNSQIVSE
jgi:hypothetical protein